jgi:hypothetical protein
MTSVRVRLKYIRLFELIVLLLKCVLNFAHICPSSPISSLYLRRLGLGPI